MYQGGFGRLLTEAFKSLSKTQCTTRAKCFSFTHFQSPAKYCIIVSAHLIITLPDPRRKKKQSDKYFQNRINKENKDKAGIVRPFQLLSENQAKDLVLLTGS